MYLFIKRSFDILFGLTLAFFSLPIMLLTAVLIKLEDPEGPVFYKAKRIGRHNSFFRLYKFRSMKVQTEKEGVRLYDNDRILKCGKYIRKFSIDELPQILNILKGEMSFIGPRPLPEKYFDYITDLELARHKVRPGISGLAQVNGRNYISWDKKFELDLHYVKNISFLIDAKIFILTLKNIFIKQDVNVYSKDDTIKSLYDVRIKINRISETSL
jgi:undecaprenyl phosphate N,N'-diacetylbacillosamine 1-phosphate transferase